MNHSEDIRSGLCASCALCHRYFSPYNEDGDLQAVISICGDCKFLLLEDHDNLNQVDGRRELQSSRQRMWRRASSESIENIFSQQFSDVINQARQNHANGYDNDNLILTNRTSTRTTPRGSRRWRWVSHSDSESDGFDSFHGESESNFSFGSTRFFREEHDAISLEGSDASVDRHGFLESDNYSHLLGGISGYETDTDLDPMHAGLYHWNSDDIEEDDVSEYIGWEDSTFSSVRPGSLQLRSSQHSLSPQQDSTMRGQIQEGTIVVSNFEEQNYVPGPELQNNLTATRFDEILEHLAETETSSRRGALPAAIFCLRNLPQLVITEQDNPDKQLEEEDGLLACAICKESLPVGTVVIQLPCSHLYHSSCILSWLSLRNSCPLCRYELPTDDKDYNDIKQQSRTRVLLDFEQHSQLQEEVSEDDSFSEAEEEVNVCPVTDNPSRENTRRGWVYLAAVAAPFFGVFLMLCFGGNQDAGKRSWRYDTETNLSSWRRRPTVTRDSGQNDRARWSLNSNSLLEMWFDWATNMRLVGRDKTNSMF